MRQPNRLVPALLLLACFALTPEALAESVVITSGRFFLPNSSGSDRFTFDLRGSGLRVTGRGDPFDHAIDPYLCFPCTEGSLNSRAVGLDLHGTITYQNQTYRFPTLEETESEANISLRFLAGNFVVPDEFRNAAAVRITSFFDFTGGSTYGYPTSNVGFEGSGVTRLLLVHDAEPKAFNLGSLEYEFLAPGAPRPQPGIEAIPEPATMLLLGTGLAGIGGMIRKRRQAKAEQC